MKASQSTDLKRAAGGIRDGPQRLEVLFEIPVWREDQLESVKRAFVECVFLQKNVWLWTSSFAIYVPRGRAAASTRRGCNTEFVVDIIGAEQPLVVMFDDMPQQLRGGLFPVGLHGQPAHNDCGAIWWRCPGRTASTARAPQKVPDDAVGGWLAAEEAV